MRKLKEIERDILTTLGYCIYSIVEHPHKFILYYVKYLEPTEGSDTEGNNIDLKYKCLAQVRTKF